MNQTVPLRTSNTLPSCPRTPNIEVLVPADKTPLQRELRATFGVSHLLNTERNPRPDGQLTEIVFRSNPAKTTVYLPSPVKTHTYQSFFYKFVDGKQAVNKNCDKVDDAKW